MSKLVLLNGPTLCGKNTAVNHLKTKYDLIDRRCKDKLFELTPILFGISPERFWEIYNDRSLKETPLSDFRLTAEAFDKIAEKLDLQQSNRTSSPNCLSVREAMIYVSECLCKPSFGSDYFGVARAEAMVDKDEIAIDDSCGFEDELPPVIELLGQRNILLIRIIGRGEFNESRQSIPDDVIHNTVDVSNTGTEDEFLEKIENIVSGFLGGIAPKRKPIEVPLRPPGEGWIPHGGVSTFNRTEVDVVTRNGTFLSYNPKGPKVRFIWKENPSPHDVIWLRVRENASHRRLHEVHTFE